DPVVGALLEVERNLHAIERRIDRLLQPMLPERGKRPGWLTLTGNGGGGFWFDVMTHFPEAVATTHDALEDLSRRVDDDDALSPFERAVARPVYDIPDLIDRDRPTFARLYHQH
ncbi:MAG: hypothetical protein QF464_01520, partial [Myxococcota bacterium]|nr:hypothetical protein [Myxococcota bacterium]